MNIEHSMILDAVIEYRRLISLGKALMLCWIPCHIGFPENDKADVAAGSARQLHISALKVLVQTSE